MPGSIASVRGARTRLHGRPRRCWRTVPMWTLSHGSAASLCGLGVRWAFPLEVTARGAPRAPGHPRPSLPVAEGRDVTRQSGSPRPLPAAHHPRHRAPPDRQAAEPGWSTTPAVNGELHPDTLQDLLARNPRHPGTKLLTPFAEHLRQPHQVPVRGRLPRLHQRVPAADPADQRQGQRPRGRRLLSEYDLIVELDGWDFHKDRDAFEDDRERDAEQPRARPDHRPDHQDAHDPDTRSGSRAATGDSRRRLGPRPAAPRSRSRPCSWR